MNSFAAHITPICGCATSMRRTLNAPTITFSTQKSSRVENTLQPKNRTPARGTRFAATSTRALGESRKARRSGTGEVTVHYDVEWRRRRQGLAGSAGPGDLGGVSDAPQRLAAVGISGSPSATSKSRVLVEYALAQLAAGGAATQMVDLAGLPADPLLGRGASARVAAAVAATIAARIIVAGTPVYRATYSGLLKVFFDLLPQDSLTGKVGVPIVTGHGAAHSLAVDHGMRPLFASLGATVVAGAVYATSQQFADGKPGRELLEAVDRAVAEARALATAGPPGARA